MLAMKSSGGVSVAKHALPQTLDLPCMGLESVLGGSLATFVTATIAGVLEHSLSQPCHRYTSAAAQCAAGWVLKNPSIEMSPSASASSALSAFVLSS
jgi:hypothetical protein